jgi:hypothetical protein
MGSAPQRTGWLASVLVAFVAWLSYANVARSEPAPASAAEESSPVSVEARLSPDPSSVGDLLTYEVTAGYPRGVTVNLPSVLTLDPLYVVEIRESEPEPTGEGLRKVFTIELQHFTVGPAEVPGFDLTWVDAQGSVQTVAVPPHAFVIESVLANEVDPQRRGEDPPVSLEYPNELAEIIAWAVMGTLFLAGVAIMFVRFFWPDKKLVLGPPPLPPHEQAYRALAELEGGELLQRKQYEDFYVQLTEIAKGYLQERFGVLALDRTTEELRGMLERDEDRIAPLTAKEVLLFLETSDLFKFAGFEPKEEEPLDAVAHVREMVDRTAPKEAKKEPAPAPEAAPEPAPESAKEDETK